MTEQNVSKKSITSTSHPSRPKVKKRALFIGRWQAPGGVHDGHLWLFQQKLKQGIPIAIAIRDVPVDENNPHTAKEVEALLQLRLADHIAAGLVIVFILPCDIESIVYGRDVGYKVEELNPPADIAAISATALRNEVKNMQHPWDNSTI